MNNKTNDSVLNCINDVAETLDIVAELLRVINVNDLNHLVPTALVNLEQSWYSFRETAKDLGRRKMRSHTANVVTGRGNETTH